MPIGVYPHKKGRVFSEEHKRKISIANKGKKRPSLLGHKFNLGKKQSFETIEKRRKSLMGRVVSMKTRLKISKASGKGKNSRMWKGGLPKCIDCGKELVNYSAKRCHKHSPRARFIGQILKTDESKLFRKRIEYRLWRESIFKRDDWTCKKCGIKGGKLHPHHVQNFSKYLELRFDINNGITLCVKHHQEFHKIYGKGDNNVVQLLEFIKK